jgi:hypothetical protein
MATFLTTWRMAPELAARIEASIRGERNASRDAATSVWKPRLVALARFGAIAAVVAIALAVVLVRRRDRRELEQNRATLLESVRAASAALTARDLGSVARVEALLEGASGPSENDFVAPELRPAGALDAALARPAVYVRGTTGQLNNPAGVVEAANASLKDSFLVCLVAPPPSRAEKVLLAKVHDAFSNAAEQHSPTVRRFRDAQAGLPYLSPSWAELVRTAKAPEDLDALRDALEKAPLERATRAAKAELLIYAMDEPGDPDPNVPTELDGERAHTVRVGLVDLTTEKVLVRLRRRVDPSWISAAKRPMYAAGLDGCALALDVREAVRR